MGNKGKGTTTYNADNLGMTTPQGVGNSQLLERYIQTAFQNAAVNGELYKDKFNETLACLEDFNIKRLRDTPLGQRLYKAFDSDKSGSISYSELLKGLKALIQDKETRIQCIFFSDLEAQIKCVVDTFKAFDHDNDGKISRKEFVDFYCESWMTAFRILAEKLKAEQSQNILPLINNWATQHLKEVREYMEGIFTGIDRMKKGYIDFMIFREWILTTDLNSIIAKYDTHSVEVPINLYYIDKDLE